MTTFPIDPSIDVSDAETVRLGDEDYLVPRMMLRQMRKIGPLMPDVLKLLNRRANAFSAIAKGDAESDEILSALTMTEAELDLAIRVIVIALGRTYPGITVAALDDMPIQLGQIPIALMAVVHQTHNIRDASSAGEAEAATSIGNDSSPDFCIDLTWTRDEVLDQIDIPFLQALNAEWNEAPPHRTMIAAFMGYEKPKPVEERGYMTPEAAKDWMSRTGGKIEGVGRL